MIGTGSISPRRYLRTCGNLSAWHYVLFAVFGGWISYLRYLHEKPSFAHYFFVFLMPVAAGSGLLTTAKSGQLDLLFGAGLSRFVLWSTVVADRCVIPAAMAFAVFALAGSTWTALLTRLPPVLCFTIGVSFAIGLVELRYTAGIIWILLRLLFIMTPAGLAASVQLSRGAALPGVSKMLAILIVAPESAVEPRMPVVYPLLGAAVGLAAIAASWFVFARSDFGGKRA